MDECTFYSLSEVPANPKSTGLGTRINRKAFEVPTGGELEPGLQSDLKIFKLIAEIIEIIANFS